MERVKGLEPSSLQEQAEPSKPGSKNARFCRPLRAGAGHRMTIGRRIFLSATQEFHGWPEVVSGAINPRRD